MQKLLIFYFHKSKYVSTYESMFCYFDSVICASKLAITKKNFEKIKAIILNIKAEESDKWLSLTFNRGKIQSSDTSQYSRPGVSNE